jgi:hypothetical protein
MGSYSLNDLACHLQIDAYPVPDPAYHFDTDRDAEPNSDFYFMLMRIPMRIQVTKMMRIRIHNTASRLLTIFSRVSRIPTPSSTNPDPTSSRRRRYSPRVSGRIGGLPAIHLTCPGPAAVPT